MPRISPVDLNCSFYLYPDEDSANRGEKIGGCGFWVAVRSEDRTWLYAVSNRHVVWKDGCSTIRANLKNGAGIKPFPTEPTDWMEFGDHDIVALPIRQPEQIISQIDVIAVPTTMFATEQDIHDGKIGVGDDVYMIGRFVNHEGRDRNTPSVRFGNISMLPSEPIWIDQHNPAQESFAVELRSMSGYSGSPVFVVLSGWRKIDGNWKMHWEQDLLLGVHWGHISDPWTVKKRIVRTAEHSTLRHGEKEIDVVAANTGMNGVVPAWRLKQLLDQPILQDERNSRSNKG